MWWKRVRANMGRLFMWKLRDIELTDQETKILDGRSFIASHLMRKYIVWRKSSLLIAGITLSLTAIVSLIGIADAGWEFFNGLGVIALLSQYFSPIVLAIVVWVSLFFWWRKPVVSFRILSYGWIVALIMSLWPLAVPIEYFIFGGLNFELEDPNAERIAQFITRVSLAVSYSISIFPTVVTIPSGIIRGSLRIRGLLPECSLAGWLIVITSPLYPLVILMALVLLSQLFGNPLLLIGAVFFMIAPTLYIFRRKLYTKPKLTEQEINRVTWNQRIIGVLTFLGVLLVGIWGFTNVELEISFPDVLRFFLNFLGQLLSNTVLFADSVFRMTLDSLTEDRIAMENTVLGETQGLLQELENDFRDIKTPRSSEKRNMLMNDTQTDVGGMKPQSSDTEMGVGVRRDVVTFHTGQELTVSKLQVDSGETLDHGANQAMVNDPSFVDPKSHGGFASMLNDDDAVATPMAVRGAAARDPSVIGEPSQGNSPSDLADHDMVADNVVAAVARSTSARDPSIIGEPFQVNLARLSSTDGEGEDEGMEFEECRYERGVLEP